jgi:hypothetical protein
MDGRFHGCNNIDSVEIMNRTSLMSEMKHFLIGWTADFVEILV